MRSTPEFRVEGVGGVGDRGVSPCLRCTEAGVLRVSASDGLPLPIAVQFAVNQLPSSSTLYIPTVLKMSVDNQ